MKSIARKSLAGLMLLAALAVTNRLAAQQQPEGSTIVNPGIANPVPLINQPLVPDATKPGGAGFTLTVNGTGFVSTSVVKWNGSARTTTFVSQSQLKATILASDIAKAGTASVTVVNPSPSGGKSNPVFFEVTPPSSSVALAQTDYGTGNASESVAVGDFNGDGKLDLAVSDTDTNTVGIFLGNGDGTFQPQIQYATGGSPSGVAAADFNGDGKLDLVVAAGAGVSVLLGNGDGTFQAHVDYTGGGVAVGDLNGDGKLDLTNGGSVLLGNGDGTFQAPIYTGVGGGAVAVGDFNGDGKLDLAVTNSTTETVSVLLGKGDGTFQTPVDYATGHYPDSVVVGDFNGDGKLDLAIANACGQPSCSSPGSVSVLLGNGDGTFQAQVAYGLGLGPSGAAVVDLNGDGKLDLVVANYDSSTVSILFGNGDGTFQTPVNHGTGNYPDAVAPGDFNRDGRLDLAVAALNVVSVLLQTPTVSLSKMSLTFADQVVITSSAAQTVTLSNTGGLTLTISSITVTGADHADFTQTNTCGTGLPAGGHCTITVTFKPTQIGLRMASVTITDNVAGSPQSIALSGTGVTSGPNATLSATSLTFAEQVVGTTSPVQSVMLSNYGTATLTIASITITGPDSGDFAQTNNCGSSVAPGASCTVNVTFKPIQIGTRTGTVSITDNAPSSPQKVSLTGTGTVVQFNPTSLAFNCTLQRNNCPPPPQTTTLTNTGSSTLTISSITITGSTTFSQTNNCGLRVQPKGSCTITVHFSTHTFGTFTGAVSVSDNGGGSPQQVALSGTETSHGMSSAARSALSTTQTAAVPSPTGPSQVGTRVMQMVDPLRDDPFLGNGTKRELLVRFWYPASSSEGCEPAAYTSPAVWNYFSELLVMPLPEVRTNSCLDAPITEGTHPVVVFTHGYTGTFTDYTFIAEDLASRGYVVAAVDHTSEATAVEFLNGRLVKSVFGSHLAENTLRRDEQSLSAAVYVRSKDLKFVVDELGRLNGEAGGPFAGELDLTRIAVAGHSLGGLAALLELKQDARFQAAVLLDASMKDGSASLTNTPVLVLAMGRDQWSDEECRLWNDLRGPRFAVNLKGAEHVTPSDAVWLAKGAIKTSPMGPDKTIGALRNYVAAFLDMNLRGKPFDPLMAGPSSDYPDAAVTTQKQSLCSEAVDH